MCLMAKYKILVAEDDDVLRDLYLRKLSRNAEYDLLIARNGQEALDLLQVNVPSLVLLDINMPVVDGFGVLEKLPKDKRSFPVIILTNFDDQANRDRGMALGVDDYFVKKDMTIKNLVEMVEKLLKK